MSWTNDVVLEFVDLYRSEQLLWDPKHPLHRNRSEVTDAWLRIQSSLSIHCSIVDLKKKKESLMTSFRMHFNKKRVHDGYRTTWFAYPLMESFLCGKYECDSTNQLESEFFNTPTYASPPQPPTIPDQTMRKLEKPNPVRRQNRSVSHSQTNPSKGGNGGSEMIYTKKQMDESVTYMKNNGGDKREMDEYELYAQLLAKKLRKLDEHQRDVAMHEIDNIMFRSKMQSGPSQSRSYSSSPSPVPRKVKSPIFIVAQQAHPQYEDENMPYQDHLQSQPPS